MPYAVSVDSLTAHWAGKSTSGLVMSCHFSLQLSLNDNLHADIVQYIIINMLSFFSGL